MSDAIMKDSVNFITLYHLVGLSIPTNKLQDFVEVAESTPLHLHRLIASSMGIINGTWKVALHMTGGHNEDISDFPKFQSMIDSFMQERHDGNYAAFFNRLLNDRKSVVEMLRESGIVLPDGIDQATLMPTGLIEDDSPDEGCNEPSCSACNGTLDRLISLLENGGETTKEDLLVVLNSKGPTDKDVKH